MCDFKTAVQMRAQVKSASRIQRMWRRNLERKHYQTLRQDPSVVVWRQQSASVKGHLLQKVTSVNMSLMSAFWNAREYNGAVKKLNHFALQLHLPASNLCTYSIDVGYSVLDFGPGKNALSACYGLTQPLMSGDVCFVRKASWHV